MYHIANGRIRTWSLEAHVVDHCNLRCAQCCTLSPHIPHSTLSIEQLAADLALLRPVLHTHVLKLTGGEPLLHPDVPGCLRAAREAAIAEHIQVTTNGFLIDRAPPEIWTLLDRLTLSVYPSAPLPEGRIRDIENACRAHEVLLTIKTMDRFAAMTPRPPQTNHDAPATFRDCWLRFRCHMVRNGRFYLCTRPPHLADYLRTFGADLPLAEADGLALNTPDLARALRAYLERPDPLDSCRYCLGPERRRIPHRQLDPGEVTGPPPAPGTARA